MSEVVPFQAHHTEAFKRIGEEWITEFMRLEEPDISILNDPQHHILEQGGYIFMAVKNDEVVGTCALVKKSEHRWELCKLGISKAHRGGGLGRELSLRIIEQAKALGLEQLYLESSSKLTAAIQLYKTLGFTEDTACDEGTSQCDIKMVLHLNS